MTDATFGSIKGAQPAKAAPIDPGALPDKIKYLIFGVMAFGQFMALIDIQIVAASLNDVQAGLSAGPDEISWMQTGYLIAELIMIPFAAFLAQALSTRYLFAMSAGLFTISSALCGMAWDIESMIAFRVHSGLRRRGHGADRLRHRLRHVRGQAEGDDPGHPRHGLGAGPDAGSHGRRLDHRRRRLALDLLRQHRPRARW
jgi:hypothetical protein